MKLTLLVNWDCASAHALSLLTPFLRHPKNLIQTKVFHTKKSIPNKAKTNELNALRQFEQQQLLTQCAPFFDFNSSLMNDINGHDFERFCDSQADVVVSIRHMSILKKPAIEAATLGVLNLHSGILPEYQGVMATFWAMKNREKKIGSTLHFIEDCNIDTGAIITQSKCKALYDKSYFENVLNIYQQGCVDICNALTDLRLGKTLTNSPQTGKARYYTYPNENDFKSFDGRLF